MLLVRPLVVALLAFAIYPLIYLIVLSGSKSLLGKPFQEWVGFSNFQAAFADQAFLWSLVRSVSFAIPVTIVEVALGLGIAVLLQQSVRGHRGECELHVWQEIAGVHFVVRS